LDLELFPLCADANRDYRFVKELLSAEPIPIFEHSYFYIIGSLLHHSSMHAIRGAFGLAVIVTSPQITYLLSPAIRDVASFSTVVGSLLDLLPGNELNLRYLTERWVDSFIPNLKGYRIAVEPRSTAEAVYEVARLTKLEGPQFRNLRARRRKLLDSGSMTFLPLNASGVLRDAISILQAWQSSQGNKYQKNRYEREVFTLEQFTSLSTAGSCDSSFEVGYCEGRPLSIACFYRSDSLSNWGGICFVKAINHPEVGGVPGASDATYCHVFRKASSLGITHLNDGDIGTEEGTRKHKMQFQPVQFLRSFDIKVRR
jgi:hypothetical protein